MSNTCVCCGREIPEGSQVCVICGQKPKQKERQIDRIRNMSIDELAEFLEEFKKYRCSNCIYHYEKEPCFDKSCEIGLKQWLLSEVTE